MADSKNVVYSCGKEGGSKSSLGISGLRCILLTKLPPISTSAVKFLKSQSKRANP